MATQTYIVQAGDSLSLISQKFFGDFSMTNALATANRIGNANLIYPGQQLIIPDAPAQVPVTLDEANKKKGKGGKILLYTLFTGAAIWFGYKGYQKWKQRKALKK